MQEEQNVLKSDFLHKIESYEKEISVLKNQSFEKPGVQADTPISQRVTSDKYADLSVNQDLKFEPKLSQEEINETRIRPSPQKAKTPRREAPKPQPAAQGGFLNSFASLFLTESEMSGAKPTQEPGEQSEYEYYEEYDDEDEDNQHVPMKTYLEQEEDAI